MENTNIQTLQDVENIQLPHEVQKTLSMLSNKEKKHLYKIASTYFKNEGLIFDAGLFFGASTLCFAKGLQNNSEYKVNNSGVKPIQSFEMGICSAYSANLINQSYPDIVQTKAGDNFLPFLRKNIQDVRSLVQLHEGDIVATMKSLPDYTYEVVFLDVLKIPAINDAVVKKIFPQMIPGRTILIQQDFVHEWLPFIHVTMGFLKDYFELMFTCGSSAFFINTKKIPKKMLDYKFYEDFEPTRILELFDRGIDFKLNDVQKYILELARSILIAEKIGKKEALEFLNTCKENYNKAKKIRPLVCTPETHIHWVKNKYQQT